MQGKSGQSMRSRVFNATFICALGAAFMLAANPVRAADDEVPLDKKIFRSVLEGLGLRKDGDGINYQERAPLVVPANRSLPEPDKGAEAAVNNPAWPKDPDITRRKEASRRERAGKLTSDAREDEQNPLRPDQIAPGGNSRTARPGQPGAGAAADGGGRVLTPSQLGYSGGAFSNMFGAGDEEVAKFTGERPRASLTDPPTGYQTPSAAQPYGLGKTTVKPTDYYTEHGTPDGAR